MEKHLRLKPKLAKSAWDWFPCLSFCLPCPFTNLTKQSQVDSISTRQFSLEFKDLVSWRQNRNSKILFQASSLLLPFYGEFVVCLLYGVASLTFFLVRVLCVGVALKGQELGTWFSLESKCWLLLCWLSYTDTRSRKCIVNKLELVCWLKSVVSTTNCIATADT